ncbi:DUF2199 domain-containing protein [Moraxella osloensis]|uniref:DUF2199 domain-containing protein n=1 Tax=Faucicola osloensis TaxID=34062 RepID=A0A2D2LVQ0_FAUOS|nr:DUF2199 domain-containing protein [Moraxella osloensis]ATR79066.1 DUF2199 domain-containing protein [Moraxella osloensis]
MTSSFICSTCGEAHDGLPTDHGWQLPDDVWAIPEDERSNEAEFNSDLCQLGNRFFIRCLLKIPFNEQPDYYGWGVWVEVAEQDFDRYIELYDKDGSSEPSVSGTIANSVPGYPPTLGLAVDVQFQDSTSRPSVAVLASAHPLAEEQSIGIDNRRYHEILAVTGSVGGP